MYFVISIGNLKTLLYIHAQYIDIRNAKYYYTLCGVVQHLETYVLGCREEMLQGRKLSTLLFLIKFLRDFVDFIS